MLDSAFKSLTWLTERVVDMHLTMQLGQEWKDSISDAQRTEAKRALLVHREFVDILTSLRAEALQHMHQALNAELQGSLDPERLLQLSDKVCTKQACPTGSHILHGCCPFDTFGDGSCLNSSRLGPVYASQQAPPDRICATMFAALLFLLAEVIGCLQAVLTFDAPIRHSNVRTKHAPVTQTECFIELLEFSCHRYSKRRLQGVPIRRASGILHCSYGRLYNQA